MLEPDLKNVGGLCPSCLTPRNHQPRMTVRRDDAGRESFGGFFTSCECGALTYSRQTGRTNLTLEVCEAYAIRRVDPNRSPNAVPPLIRRRRDGN